MECLDLLLAAGADVNLRVQNESLDHSPLEMAMMWDDHGDLRRETATSNYCAPSSRRASTPIYAIPTVT